jgi:hypothetical protein
MTAIKITIKHAPSLDRESARTCMPYLGKQLAHLRREIAAMAKQPAKVRNQWVWHALLEEEARLLELLAGQRRDGGSR